MTRTDDAVDLRPVLLVLIGSLGIQSSAIVSSTLFAELGTVAVSTFRLVIAAVMLLVAFRPAVRTFSRGRWINACIYGIAMAAMNQFYFAAVDRLPLGVVVTLDFLGPCLVSFLGLKHWRERGWALMAFIGVVLIAGPSSGMDPVGLIYGFLAGGFFAAYTVFAERVGKAEGGGLSDLAISVAVAALVTLPIAAPKLIDVSPNAWLVLTLAALIGVVIPYIADTLAARITSAQVVGTLFALDPVVGSILGWLLKGDELTARMLIGIPLVALAGAIITWRSKPRGEAGGSAARPQVQDGD
ncbi:EamA family transporter [Corynebacterium appendicis]|uniref:EamA family transporter n=1 Tax=Corynebacterium appendicis TaxID=163202 RepID=UPI00254D4504|nr:EamA family transporter [Corynebacterium appendicis]MDK8624787.1 EamA family transporter [Corynebacterium appendicis]